jgi:hypothetical protein
VKILDNNIRVRLYGDVSTYVRKNSNVQSVRLFQLFRRFPFIFALIAFAGLAVGYFLTFVCNDGNVVNELAFRFFGIACLIFYGVLLMMFFFKLINKRWGDFCDRMIARLDDYQSKREGLAVSSPAKETVGQFQLKHDLLLICSVGVLALELLVWIMHFYMLFPRLCLSLSAYAFIFAPVFIVLAVMDILKRGLTWQRIVAFLCSLSAVILVAVTIYLKLHET